MSRLPPLRLPLIVVCVAVLAAPIGDAQTGKRLPSKPFTVVEATIPEMQAAMAAGRVTSREIVRQSLIRIALYEETLNAVIAVNPGALEEAEALDRERAQGKVRGPLHGMPIALKDNIHTTNMPTTGGALAFEGFVPPYEATITKQLREAGAVIIAKTVLTELANWVASGMPANYSALGGFGMNPYDPRRDPRERTNDGRGALSTGGSSSGIGTAASFWAANVGTETSGSILSPANAEHAGRHQAHGRADQPLWRDPNHGRSGHPWSDGADRHRCGDPAGRARRRGGPIRTMRRRRPVRRRPAATTRGSSRPAR